LKTNSKHTFYVQYFFDIRAVYKGRRNKLLQADRPHVSIYYRAVAVVDG